MGNEIYTLMKQEFAEASEPVPPVTVGSSTMPQKRNPILAQDVVAGAAQLRALVPLALESMMTEHEANRATSVMMRSAIGPAAIHAGDILGRLITIASGMTLDPERMRRNLEHTGGMILSEALMMELGKTLGRQEAHDVVYDIVEKVIAGETTFAAALASAPGITQRLTEAERAQLMEPAQYTGLCASMAREQAALARAGASRLKAHVAGMQV